MSSLPFILSLADDLDRRLAVASTPFYANDFYNRCPWLAIAPKRDLERGGDCVPAPKIGKDGFQVCMDVGQFKPSEITVKVVDNTVRVEGKHEEREDDHGYISRHFVRRYTLPKGYEADKVASTLSSDGVLTVSVPKPQLEDKSTNERVIQIQQVGPAHLNVKENPKEDVKADKLKEGKNGK